MSLLCWFPLCDNGDLSNKGLYNISLTAYGSPVYSTGGKVGGGGCYKFNETTTPRQYLYSSAPLHEKLNNHSFSICGWIKSISNGDTFGRGDIVHVTYGIGFSTSYLYLYNTAKMTFVYSNTSVNDGNWHHMCGTYDETTGNMCYYVDGILKGTNTYDGSYASSWTNGFTIAWDPNNSIDECYTKGYIQDVRVYDHTLSTREVYEISKALVLHYPMNNVTQPNLLKNPNTNYFMNSGTDYQNGVTASYKTEDGYSIVRIQRKSTDYPCYWYGYYQTRINSFPYKPNTKYTVSAEIKSNYHGHFFFDTRISAYDQGSCSFSSTNNTWMHFSATWTTPPNAGSDTLALSLIALDKDSGCSTNDYAEIRKCKIEEGDCATPYDISTYVTDVSGYNRHGTINGTLTVTSDTKKYNCSTVFNNVGIATSYTNGGLNTFTYAAWVKLTAYHSERSCISIGGTYFTIDNSGRLSGYAYGRSSEGYHTGNATIALNTWTHVALVWTTTQLIGYVNGVQDFVVNNTGSFSHYTNQAIGSEYADQYSRNFTGMISDLRMYATALSADDIKDLYNVSAYIDNFGSLHTFELNETLSNLLRYENTVQYTNPNNTSTRGLLTTRNNTPALAFRPTDTYFGTDDDKGKLLYNMFLPNTQYLFDLWIDTDDVIYNERNVSGGFEIVYTDGTTYSGFVLRGANPGETPKGFQHHVYISTANKTVSRLSIYYYTNVIIYVRSDSFICALNNVSINQTGVIDSGQFIEDTDVAYIGNADFHANNIIET